MTAILRPRSDGTRNWRNRTIWTGDNLSVMRGMNSASVDLIYLDPPFNSNRNYSAPIGSEAAGAAFKDTWTLDDVDLAEHGEIADRNPALYKVIDAAGDAHGKGMKSYLIMMGTRLLEMRRLLKDTGSIYLHCDPTASHYLKLVMDAVFGASLFRNEIVWCFTTPSTPYIKQFPRSTNSILWYSKSKEWVFRRDDVRVPYAGGEPHGGTGWLKEGQTLEEWRAEQGKKGKIAPSWWSDIYKINNKERLGYPTQKPLALLKRIIAASSNLDDVVLDPFCGCATACIAAEQLDRQWVGIDLCGACNSTNGDGTMAELLARLNA